MWIWCLEGLRRVIKGVRGAKGLGVTPLHCKWGEAGEIETGVAQSVRDAIARKQVCVAENTFEREAEFLDDSAAGFVATRVGDADSSHLQGADGVLEQGVGGLSREALPLCAFADPEAGFAVVSLPVEAMKAAPDDGTACRDFDAHEVELLAQDELCHDLAGADLRLLGGIGLRVFGPGHPAVEVFPGFRDSFRGQGTVAGLLGTYEETGRSDRHRNFDEDRVHFASLNGGAPYSGRAPLRGFWTLRVGRDYLSVKPKVTTK